MDNNIDWAKLGQLGLRFFHIQWQTFASLEDADYDFFPENQGTLDFATHEEADEFFQLALEEIQKVCDKDHMYFRLHLYCDYLKYQWIREVCSWKMRVAPPDHRVFICVAGTDCDGMSFRRYSSYKHLEDALKDVEEDFAWADGPQDYCTMSAYDWETAEYSEYRDPYAERMGY